MQQEPYLYTCIVVDASSGAPMGCALISSSTDPKASDMLNEIHSRRFLSTSVVASSGLFSLTEDVAPSTTANNLKELKLFRSDWRELADDCRHWSSNVPLSAIRRQYKAPDDLIYLISFCDTVQQPALRTTQEEVTDRRGHTTKANRNRPSIAASIQAKVRAPSTSANNDQLLASEVAGRNDAIYDGRPSDLSGPSIAIFHPIFAEFEERLTQLPLPGDIPAVDLKAASSFMRFSAQYFPSENDRHPNLASILRYFTRPSFNPRETSIHYGEQTIKPDGHAEAYCGLYQSYDEPGVAMMTSLLMEIRNGVGQGDRDPLEQAAKGYLVVSSSPELSKLREKSCMPAFLLGITGSYIAVSGAIYLDGVVTERLTDMISLVPVQSSRAPIGDYASAREKCVHKVAHFLRTLQYCLNKLNDEYLAMSPSNDPEDVLLPAPHFSSFTIDSHTFKISYRSRFFESRDKRAVFLADVHSSSAPAIRCVVKFTSRYCSDVHRYMEAVGVAPKLLYCNFEPSVGQFCVVTEYIEAHDTKLTTDAILKLQAAVEGLHAKSYVLGDLREANILVDKHGSAHVIDFDWSGMEGSVLYPTDINMADIKWVHGVEPGGKITRQHDAEMLRMFLDSL